MDKTIAEMLKMHEQNSTLPDAKKVYLYTNKSFQVFLQSQSLNTQSKIAKEIDTDQFYEYLRVQMTVVPTTAETSSCKSKVKLLPENRVNIKTLGKNIDTPLKGKFFLCRCITIPLKMTSIMTVVDDPEGELVIRIALYDYTAETRIEKVLPVGTILAICNPWFKTAADGGLILRCDSPADVVVVNQEIMSTVFGHLKWAGEIPSEYLAKGINLENDTVDPVLKLKNLGNKSFVEKNYVDAVKFYTEALKVSGNNVDVLANRAASYLNLGCYNKAIVDTSAVLELNPFHVKAIYRQCRSLWGLNRYEDALKFLTSKFKEEQKLKMVDELSSLKSKGELLLKQHKTGGFDILEFLIAQKEQKSIDVAEYVGPVQLVESIPGKGRGLVATEKIDAGQLIICSKAFAAYYCGMGGSVQAMFENMEITAKYPGDAELAEIIAKKLALDPELRKQFYKLFAGPNLGSLSEEEIEQTDLVDLSRINKIITFNAFSSYEKNTGNKLKGIWLLPSFINHSCSEANCRVDMCGEVMFIRAIKSIEKGVEILIPYMQPSAPFPLRKIVFISHDFVCQCTLCQLEMEESESIHQRIVQILKNLDKLKKMGLQLDTATVMKNIEELESLRNAHPELNLFLEHPPISKLGALMFHKGDHKRCLELLKKIHFVTKDTAMAYTAAEVSGNILGCYITMGATASNKRMVDKWVETLKHDLIVAFGSVQAARILCPNTIKSLDCFGWNSFL